MLTTVERALDLLLPPNCAGCGALGAPCCRDCLAVWEAPGPVPRGPAAAAVPAVYALARYRGTARRLVLAYKERGRRDLAAPLGAALAAALPGLPEIRAAPDEAWWLVPVPSRKPAARLRGGQHVLRLARACAATLAAAGHPARVAPALALSSRARDAVGLDRAQRAANLTGRLRLEPRGLPPPATPVILLDDVITTGATASLCGRILSENGFPVTVALALTAAG
ncbi:ComF family protein [Amycolatopsis anabasis]|uniref:ComF family protein n=1 Tax=Amycolatopsis anabasis TaxID=1840409 RepID=UPI00131CE4F2|nr:ComF family protein [Amycolatopsis anabasis]